MINRLINATLVAITISGLLISCQQTEKPKSEETNPADLIRTDFIDATVPPQEDFFAYANGSWLNKNPIPSTENSWGTFNELRDNNLKVLKQILDNALAGKLKGDNGKKLGDFYKSGMDSTNIEKLGAKPIEPFLAKIQAIKTSDDVLNVCIQNLTIGSENVFAAYVDQDAKNSTSYALYFSQSGLGLPDRDYYSKQDDNTKKIKEEYLKHITNLFILNKTDKATAEKNAKLILDLETALAKSSMGRVEMRDPYATYHKFTIEEAQKQIPNFNWNQIINGIQAKGVKEIIVSQPEFFKTFASLLKSTPIETWKTYLTFKTLSSFASELSSDFVNQDFAFNATVLNGTKEIEPRWKRILKKTDGLIGEILGQEYVKVAFTPEAKEKMVSLVNNLRGAFKERIEALDWMSAETKTKALDKLAKITVKIGYPDKWNDYTSLEIKGDDFIGNLTRAYNHEFNRNINKLGKPIDRTEWGMTPPTVNAYYNPVMNEIVFPAGILQPPFFDPKGDDAMNYGAIGAVIGHELTHGFDDEGRNYDAEGNLKDWWTKEDADKFTAKAKVIVEQFNNFVAIDTLKVNGQLTLGENIADLGGLTIAFHAYKKSLGGKIAPEYKGLTAEQRFFLAWGQGWKINMRDESLRKMVLTNPHSPAKFRVNGPLSNMTEFHDAYKVKDGDKMKRSGASQAKIW